MFTLGQLAESEHELLGAISDEELLGALDAASPNDKRLFLARARRNARLAASSPSSRSRGEFERRIKLLPREIQIGLANQSLQAVDSAYYVVKNIGGSKVAKMFKDDDNKVVGVSNISSGKLEKGNYMLLWGIQVLGGYMSLNGTTYQAGYLDVIPEFLRNGEFELKANGSILVPNSVMSVFDTYPKTVDKGLYVLDNPKILKDQHPIEMNLEWAINAPENFGVKVVLRGTSVIKA